MSTVFDPYYKWLGIAPKDQPPNHYRLLGIDLFEPDREVIDAAANRLMSYLQDLASGEHAEDSQKLLNEIAAARLCLLAADEKAGYDGALKTLGIGVTPAPPVAPPPAASTPAPVQAVVLPSLSPTAGPQIGLPADHPVEAAPVEDLPQGLLVARPRAVPAAPPATPSAFPAIEAEPRATGKASPRSGARAGPKPQTHSRPEPPDPSQRRKARRQQNQLAMALLLGAAIILGLLIVLLASSSL